MNDHIIIFIAAVCALVAGALAGSLIEQGRIYTKCLEAGHTVQMCKELTT